MNGQHIPITGGCLCGAVRYASDARPLNGGYCHCRMCQKSYGGLFGAFLHFGPGFRITDGEPRYCRSSRFARRGFCPACGSGLTFSYEGNPDLWVTIGSLDHPEDWPMTRDASWGWSKHVEVETRVAWYHPGDGLPLETSAALARLKQAAKDHVAET